MKLVHCMMVALVAISLCTLQARRSNVIDEVTPKAPDIRYGRPCDMGYHSEDEVRDEVAKSEGEFGQQGDVCRH